MLNIYVKMGTECECAVCGRQIHIGQRVVTDGVNDFDTCQCAETYRKDC